MVTFGITMINPNEILKGLLVLTCLNMGCASRQWTSAPPTESKTRTTHAHSRFVFDHLSRGPVATILITFGFGSIDETKNSRGIADAVINGLLFKGAPLADALQRKGCFSEAWVEPTFTGLALRAETAQLETCLSLVSDALRSETEHVISPRPTPVKSRRERALAPLLGLTYSGLQLGQVPVRYRRQLDPQTIHQLKQMRYQPKLARAVVIADKVHHTQLKQWLISSFGAPTLETVRGPDPKSQPPERTMDVEVQAVSAGPAEISIAIPITIDSPQTAARADLLSAILKERFTKRVRVRKLNCGHIRAFVYSPTGDARLIVSAHCGQKNIDSVWDTLFKTIVDLRHGETTRSEFARALATLESQFTRIRSLAIERGRAKATLQYRWASDSNASTRWNDALGQLTHTSDDKLMDELTSAKGLSGLLLIPSKQKSASSSLYAETLRERAKSLLATVKNDAKEGVLQVSPGTKLVLRSSPDQDVIAVHVSLTGGSRQASQIHTGAARMSAAMIALTVPSADVSVSPESIHMTVLTSPTDVTETLIRIQSALESWRRWSIDEFESARQQVLANLDINMKQADWRFQFEVNRALQRVEGWLVPGFGRVRSAVRNITPARVRAWFGRYVQDTPKTIVITGPIHRKRMLGIVKETMVSQVRSKTSRADLVSPSKPNTASDVSVVTTDQPRMAVLYRYERPSNVVRATLQVIAELLTRTLNRSAQASNGKTVQYSVTATDQKNSSYLVIKVTYSGRRKPIDKTISQALLKLANTTLDRDEFLVARGAYVGRGGLTLSSPKHLSRWLSTQVLHGSGYITRRAVQNWRTTSDGVSPVDVQKVAGQLIKKDATVTRVIGMAVNRESNELKDGAQ